jgi:type IV secretory pathway TrbD component
MLRQLLVGATVSVCNIAIHALVMTLVVEISSRIARAKHTVQQSLRLTTVMIATVSIATVPVLMAAHFSEVMVWSLAYAIVDAAAGADPVYFAFVNYRQICRGGRLPSALLTSAVHVEMRVG